MHASESAPGEAWPVDMSITIQDVDSLIFLLFVRSAWGIVSVGVPDLEFEPAVGSSRRPPSVGPVIAEQQWRVDWDRAWQPFSPRRTGIHSPDPETQRMLDTLSDEELWVATSGVPSDLWDEGVDRDALWEWQQALEGGIHRLPLEEHPERQSLPALIDAWRTGLTTVIELPFAGYYADRLDQERLLVSMHTRRDPALYSRALRTAIPI